MIFGACLAGKNTDSKNNAIDPNLPTALGKLLLAKHDIVLAFNKDLTIWIDPVREGAKDYFLFDHPYSNARPGENMHGTTVTKNTDKGLKVESFDTTLQLNKQGKPYQGVPMYKSGLNNMFKK